MLDNHSQGLGTGDIDRIYSECESCHGSPPVIHEELTSHILKEREIGPRFPW
jgi:hypothetical protein